MTVIAAVLAVVYEAIQKSGDLSQLNWKTIATTAVITGLGYLFKNGILEPPKTIVVAESNSDIKQITKEVKETVKNG